MSTISSEIARKDHSHSIAAAAPAKTDPIRHIAIFWFCIGAALWIASALGIDPTNIPQRQDFEHFHLPSLLAFSTRPFVDAIADYPAAPFPLFYLLAGWIHETTGSILVVQAWTVALAVGLLVLAFSLARARFGGAQPEALLLCAAILVGPYFRGQSVYANTDILALLFAFGAIWAFGKQVPRFPSRRAVIALALACLAVYTRQFYVFLPAYLFILICVASPWKNRIAAAAFCAALAMPVVALVVFWGGLTPPRFREHAMAPSFSDSIPAVILLLAFYATPLAVVTAWFHRDAFMKDLRRPSLQLMALPVLLLGAYLLLRSEAIPDVIGGGIPLHLLKILPAPNSAKAAMLAAAVIAGGTYLAYLIQQDVLRNGILVLIAICFFPTGILYQRYFDPLMPLIYTSVLSTREMSERSSARLAMILIVALELGVAAIGILHYRTVFAGDAG